MVKTMDVSESQHMWDRVFVCKYYSILNGWLGGVVVNVPDSRLRGHGSGQCTARQQLWPSC